MLTTTQREALAFIDCYQRAQGGVSPSLSEIAVAVGFSPRSKAAGLHLVLALESQGWIRRLRGRARAIEIVRHSFERKNRQAYLVWDDGLKALIPWDGRKRSEAGA